MRKESCILLNVKKLMQEAFNDLQKTNDPYQHGMLSAVLAIAQGINATASEELRADLENAPAMKQEAPKASEKKAEQPAEASKDDQLKGMTKSSEKIASVMNEAAKKTEEAKSEDDFDIEMKTVDVVPKQGTPTPALTTAPAAPAETVDPSDTEEWQNKVLTVAELDDTMTPRMKKNKHIAKKLADMQKLVAYFQKKNAIGWMNAKIQACTCGNMQTAEEVMNSPKYITAICDYIKAEILKLQNTKRQTANQAA